MTPDEKRKNNFAQNLRTLRRRVSLSQEDLANLLGVTNSTVSVWEQGKGYPRLDTFIALAELLDTNVVELLGIQFETPLESKNAMLTFDHQELSAAERTMLLDMLRTFRNVNKEEK